MYRGPDMESPLFLREWSRRRMAANGLGIILFQFADWLQAKGYSRNSIHQYTEAVEHFGFWRSQEHPFSRKVTVSEIDEFLSSHLACCRCGQPANKTLKTCRTALHRLLEMFGYEKGGLQSDSRSGPIAVMVGQFDRHMVDVCGLCAATRLYRRRYAREFVTWRFKGRKFNPSALCFADFLRYVNFRAPSLEPASTAVMITSLRSLVRYFEFGEQCSPGLSRAWPTVSHWKRTVPTDILTVPECRNLLGAVDAKHPAGQRDVAILRLILDLGLRCSEVAGLSLEDIDWRKGTLTIRKTKQRRERLLPLPPSVGKAIGLYLRTGRPKAASRVLFLCHRLPVGQPITIGRVRGAVRRAMHHMGRDRGGPHLLRHTFATALHNRGASLKEVADILGHQSFDTTAIYARVNLRQLETVAMPWPGET